MNPSNPNAENNPLKSGLSLAGKIFSFLITVIGAVGTINELIKPIQAERLTVTILLSLLGLIPAVVLCIYLGWFASARPKGDRDSLTPQQAALETARRALAILEQQAAGYTTLTIPAHLQLELEDKRKEVAHLELGLRLAAQSPDSSRPEQLHARNYQKFARIGLIVILLGAVVGAYGVYQHNNERNAKFIVLVLDFIGPDPLTYQVKDEMVKQLKNALEPYQAESEVIGTVNIQVTEGKGSPEAIKIGKANNADLVLWGRYQIEDTYVKVTVHVENLAGLSRRTLPSKDYTEPSVTDQFQFEDKLSDQFVAMALFISGMTRYEANDFSSAEERLNAAIELGVWPDQLVSNTILYFYRGYSRLQLKKYPESIADFNKVIESLSSSSDPEKLLRTAKAYNNIGKAYEGLGEPEEAINYYKEAIASDATYITARLNLGIAYGNSGQLNLARSEFDQILGIDPNNLSAYNNIGWLLQKTGDLQGSITKFNQALEIDSSYYLSYYNRGFSYQQLGQMDRAIADYNQAIRKNPDYPKSYNNRGNLYINQGKYDSAIADLNEAIRLDSTYAKPYMNLGRVYEMMGKYAIAIENFNSAIKYDPQDPWVYYYRGRTYIALNQNEPAASDFKMALSLTKEEQLIQLVNTELQKLGQ